MKGAKQKCNHAHAIIQAKFYLAQFFHGNITTIYLANVFVRPTCLNINKLS
jgi:hypothetical protein